MVANGPRQAHKEGRGGRSAPGDGGPLEAAAFIAETAIELTEMAHRHRLGTLAYLLDMVRMEAEEYARTSRANPPY
jgi:hypothetical protein